MCVDAYIIRKNLWFNVLLAPPINSVPEKPISPGSKTLPQSKFPQQLQQNNTEKLGMSDAATLPVRRRLVWGEPTNAEDMEIQPSTLEEREEKENKQEWEEDEKVEANDKDANTDNNQE